MKPRCKLCGREAVNSIEMWGGAIVRLRQSTLEPVCRGIARLETN